VTPRTVVEWHRAGFRLYWKWLSRAQRTGGRPPVDEQIRGDDLSHGGGKTQLGSTSYPRRIAKLLGFKVSEPTVSRWLQRAPRSPEGRKDWLTFLRNHREAIAAMDFFTVPTLTFGVLYCYFVLSHGRRKVLRCNLTRNPSALWIVQQMREAWPYAKPRYPSIGGTASS